MKVGRIEFGPLDKALHDAKVFGVTDIVHSVVSEQLQSSWVKIEDGCEMPEDGQRVWAWNGVCSHECWYMADGIFREKDTGSLVIGDVTHWMYWNHPTPPK